MLSPDSSSKLKLMGGPVSLMDSELSIPPCLYGKQAHVFRFSITFKVRKNHIRIVPETLVERA